MAWQLISKSGIFLRYLSKYIFVYKCKVKCKRTMEHTYIHHVGLCVEFELPCFTIILQIKDMYSRSSSSHFFQCSSVFVFYLFQWSIFGGGRTKVTTSQDCDKQKDRSFDSFPYSTLEICILISIFIFWVRQTHGDLYHI